MSAKNISTMREELDNEGSSWMSLCLSISRTDTNNSLRLAANREALLPWRSASMARLIYENNNETFACGLDDQSFLKIAAIIAFEQQLGDFCILARKGNQPYLKLRLIFPEAVQNQKDSLARQNKFLEMPLSHNLQTNAFLILKTPFFVTNT
jgi:hypothetical protein